jgi:hypothetical protein
MLVAFGRFILRFFIIPFGMIAGALAAVLVVSAAHWHKFALLVSGDPAATESILTTLVYVGPALALILSIGAIGLLLPAVVGILLSEVFAIRSWIFHALNGGLSIWIGWFIGSEFRKDYEFFEEPVVVVAAGIAAGFAYWAVAGWNAGFWKPVFRRALPAGPPAAATSR